MKNIAVIGLGFGDEGKGLVTNFLADMAVSEFHNPLVIRFSGGQQAGHTVKQNGVSHVFSNFGSGTFSGAPTYWSKFCTADPVAILNEVEILKKKCNHLGVSSPVLWIDERTPLTTPFEIVRNRGSERYSKDGTCGVGVGETLKREEEFYSLTFGDLFYDGVLERKLELLQKRYNDSLPPTSKIFIDVSEFVNSCKKLISSENIFPSYGVPSKEDFDVAIFEGSQGLMLDPLIGYFPHVTRSSVGSKNVNAMVNGAPIEYFLVTRAYQTRHGNGPMSNENFSHNIKIDPEETNVFNQYQGEFRRALLDVDQLLYAISRDHLIRSSKNKNLVITCMDHIENEYRYTRSGKIVYCNDAEDFAKKVAAELKIEKLYISKTPYSNLITRIS